MQLIKSFRKLSFYRYSVDIIEKIYLKFRCSPFKFTEKIENFPRNWTHPPVTDSTEIETEKKNLISPWVTLKLFLSRENTSNLASSSSRPPLVCHNRQFECISNPELCENRENLLCLICQLCHRFHFVINNRTSACFTDKASRKCRNAGDDRLESWKVLENHDTFNH